MLLNCLISSFFNSSTFFFRLRACLKKTKTKNETKNVFLLLQNKLTKLTFSYGSSLRL